MIWGVITDYGFVMIVVAIMCVAAEAMEQYKKVAGGEMMTLNRAVAAADAGTL